MRVKEERMLNNIKNKIRNQAGETIAETLVALLIAALALTMLAGAVTTASGMVLKSKDRIDKYQDRVEAAVTASTSPTGDTTIAFADPDAAITEPVPEAAQTVNYYEITAFGNKKVIRYQKK